MISSFHRTALVLGLLSAIGPFAIDMYLPALPSIGNSLGASVSAVQASLMAFFVSLGIGQIIYGPVSDMIGRKAPLYFGLLLFGVGSVGCALAPNIETLIVLRFIQGLGACAGMVVPRAVVRDLHTGEDAARLMSLLMLVFSVSPILAPLSGSLLTETFGWRSVFWAVTLATVLGALLLYFCLPETRLPEQRAQSSVKSAWADYALLMRDWNFLGLVFIGAFAMGGFFVYLANSSFVFIDHYGFTPRQFGLAFAANAASFIGVSQLTGRLTARFGLPLVIKLAVGGFAAAIALLVAQNLMGVDRWPVFVVLFMIGSGFVGLVVPTTAVLALEQHGERAGTASALMGTLQFATGVVVMAIAGRFIDGTARPMIMSMGICALLTFFTARATLGTKLR